MSPVYLISEVMLHQSSVFWVLYSPLDSATAATSWGLTHPVCILKGLYWKDLTTWSRLQNGFACGPIVSSHPSWPCRPTKANNVNLLWLRRTEKKVHVLNLLPSIWPGKCPHFLFYWICIHREAYQSCLLHYCYNMLILKEDAKRYPSSSN